jgi:pimeloyl-ACP methyl ester carboxylesterase
MSEPRGLWVRKTGNRVAVVFVHGFLSSGESCWQNGNCYWPDLLAKESSLEAIGIYVFSYRTDMFSGSYSIGDAVEALNTYLKLDGLLRLDGLVFVCHSMGGIVVRQFLVTRQATLIEESIRIGLFLVASPSLGSEYANLFSVVAKVLGNTEAQALRFADDNAWLNDLDRNFLNLKESKRLSLVGQELVEDQFVLLPTFLRRQVVPPFSGAKYFENSIKIPKSDHFTIAKPSDANALQHRLLVRFIGEFVEAFVATPSSERSSAQDRLHDLRNRAARLSSRGKDVSVSDFYYFYISKDKVSKLTGRFVHRSVPEPPPTIDIGTAPRMGSEFRERCKDVSQLASQLSATEPVIELSEYQIGNRVAGWVTGEINLKLLRDESTVLILGGSLGGLGIELVCSKDGFLDYDPNTQSLSINSTNHRFLGGQSNYTFRTMFIVLESNETIEHITGSPLYLAIPSGVL